MSLEVSVREYLVHIIILIKTVLQVITPYYFGDKIASKSQQIISSSYETSWYEESYEYKKLIVILMQCNQKSMKVKMLRMYNLTHEKFTSVSHL